MGSASGSAPGRRAAALGVTALVALIVLWPVLAHPDTDGFPLSTYPMFSTRRPSAAAFATVVGVDGAGRSHWLTPTLVNGTREVVQAAAVVQRQVADGRADQLCAEVAERVARAGVVATEQIQVVTVRYDTVGYFSAAGPATTATTATRTATSNEATGATEPERDDRARPLPGAADEPPMSLRSALAGGADRLLSPAPAERLAAARVLIGGYGLVYLVARMPHLLDLSALPPGRWQPVGILEGLGSPPPAGLAAAGAGGHAWPPGSASPQAGGGACADRHSPSAPWRSPPTGPASATPSTPRTCSSSTW